MFWRYHYFWKHPHDSVHNQLKRPYFFFGGGGIEGGYPGTFFMSWWEEFCMQFPCIGVGCKVIKYSLEKNIVSLGFAVVKDADGQSDTIFSSPKWWL